MLGIRLYVLEVQMVRSWVRQGPAKTIKLVLSVSAWRVRIGLQSVLGLLKSSRANWLRENLFDKVY